MDIREVHQKFGTDEQCLAYIQQMRWPDGIVRCTVCGSKEVKRYERPRDEKSSTKNKRGWFYICLEPTCRQQFSATSGTIFHDTHLPLIVWFHAITLVLNAKKGISAKQLQRDLGIGGYKTAWYLNHRIREAMAEGDLPKLGGTVEIDETYVGGKQKGRRFSGRASEATHPESNKRVVIGLRQRGGPLRMVHAKDATSETIGQIIKAHVDPDVDAVMTDEFRVYPKALIDAGIHGSKHKTIRHKDRIYVEGDVYTNTVENAFSLFKRGLIGSFHLVSIKHLARYLDEFGYRFNRRKDPNAFIETVRRLCDFKPLPFDILTAKKA